MVIELAEMALHGTFSNLHTYHLFRAAQLPSVLSVVNGTAAPELHPSPGARP